MGFINNLVTVLFRSPDSAIVTIKSDVGSYHLREAHADGQYCTAEVAIALLDLAGDAPAAAALGEHFTRFRTRYLAGKTQHKGSITAGQVENV